MKQEKHPFSEWHDKTPMADSWQDRDKTELVRIERQKAWNAALDWATRYLDVNKDKIFEKAIAEAQKKYKRSKF